MMFITIGIAAVLPEIVISIIAWLKPDMYREDLVYITLGLFGLSFLFTGAVLHVHFFS